MKEKIIKENVSKTLIFIMLFTIVLFYGGIRQVKAADTKFVTEQLDIETYATLETAPKPSKEQYKDWLFAGWYEDEECTQYIVDKAGLTGQKYAKFVPAEVLSVKCQNLQGTSESSETTSLRVVTTVDNLYYQEVGFDIQIGNTKKTISTKTVYKKITANTGGVTFSYDPTVFSNASSYFSTVTLTNVPNRGFSKGIFLKAYWITLDGTKVYGVGRYARIEDSWLKVVNIPIRLYTNKEVAAGRVKVQYDANEYQYIGTDTGDIGDVFQEMYVKDNGTGIISCVGNTNPIEDVSADGLMVNLRFKKIGTNENTTEIFNVSDEDFANYEGKSVYTDDTKQLFDVSNVVYK